MRVIQEHDGSGTAENLAEAWATPDTFAFAPRKSGVEHTWLDGAVGLLPEPLRRDHFGLLTSGTTGDAKLVIGARARAEALTRVLHEAQDSAPVEETIVMLPLAYSYAFVNQWLWARVHGRRLVMTQGLRAPGEALVALERARAAMLCLVPSQLPLLLAHCAERTFPGVIRLHLAGGRFPEEARLAALRRLFPRAVIYNNYGCAEAMPRLCLRRADTASSARAGDVGLPIAGVSLSLSTGSELSFRSSYRAVAQVDADGFRSFDDDEWVATGDIAQQLGDGHWEIAGRANEVFKRYGEKVSVANVLAALGQVFGGEIGHHRSKDRGGEAGYVIVLSPAPSASEVAAALHTLRATFARSQWPLRIESIAAMPLLPNGKPDARALATGAGRTTHWDQRV